MIIDNIEIKAFLFDLDGVIIDSEREYTRIWETICREFPVEVENFATRIKGTNLENILSTYYPDESVRESVRARLYEEEARMVYAFCPGAREFLDRLVAEGVQMALYTSSDTHKMNHLYRDVPEIRDYFPVTVTGSDVTRSKPDPEGYLIAAVRLGVTPEDCVVVEDSLQGVKAGRAAGSKVVGVSGTLAAEVLSPYSDIVISNLMQL